MDIITVLKKLGSLERELGNAYEWSAKQFVHDEQARDFFRKLSEEERQHLDLIKYQERVVQRAPKEFSGVDIDVPAIEKTLNAIAEFRKTTPAVKDAIRFALDIETEVVECYAATVMERSNPSFAELVRGFASNMSDDHYKQLIEFGRNYPA
jgi:rubrerythrin